MPLKGRPKKADNERKDSTMRVVVTAEEKAQIKQKAKNLGLSVSGYIRKVLDIPPSEYGSRGINKFKQAIRYNAERYREQTHILWEAGDTIRPKEYAELRVLLEKEDSLYLLPEVISGIIDNAIYGNILRSSTIHGLNPPRLYSPSDFVELLRLIGLEKEINLTEVLKKFTRGQVLGVIEDETNEHYTPRYYKKYLLLKYFERPAFLA
ncbi:hypothetical protein ACFL3T_02380 [Patescibacteria group bacterium]